MNKTIVVWFSCGAASAVAAQKTIERYGHSYNIRIVNNPILEEDIDNRRFLKDVEKWLGVKIELAINKDYPNCSAREVWDRTKFMGSIKGARCTSALKIGARAQWEEKNAFDYMVLGFTAEEHSRYMRFKNFECPYILPVLIETKIYKTDCYRILKEAGLELPRIYKQGYPNANCIGCVKATSPTYWNHVRKMHPGIFDDRAKQSREIGARLVRYKGKRIFLDELPENAKGRALKNMQNECGIFCSDR